MIKPNFSESQLQQLVNTEITMRLYSHFPTGHYWRRYFHPVIINLIEENDLGWDTAFFFPWLSVPPHADHRGYNFFIQYKRSKLIEGHRGIEWHYWNKPYLRFQIPYSTKNKLTNQYFDDYNQFYHLKDLADMGYYVYYFTNYILYRNELLMFASNQQLLNETPILDVADINGNHKKTTFTNDSPYFLLHSKLKETKKLNWDKLINIIKKSDGTFLSKDVEVLKEFIFRIEEKTEIYQKGGFREEIMKFADWSKGKKVISEAIIISKYLRRSLDLYWFKS